DKSTLKSIDLEISPGEVVCLLGPSGSGKTTLLRLAAGLAEPSGGRIFINHSEVSNEKGLVPPEKRGVGLVFQDFALFPHMSVLKNVEFGLTQLSRSERAEHALRMLDTVGLKEKAASYPNSLSGGEQQRVALARALAPKPGILLMDEPFSGLDARLRDSVRDETLALLRETRSTVIIVTHDPEEALLISDRIVLMQEGEIVQNGSCDDLYHRPNCLFAARFFSELNSFTGEYDGRMIRSSVGEFALPEKLGDELVGAKFDICIRPSDLVVTAAGADSGEKLEFRAAVSEDKDIKPIRSYITARRPMGDSLLVKMVLLGDDYVIHLKTKPSKALQKAQWLNFYLPKDRVLIFKAPE
ncbi:MAG: ABC transporter ATP-binding protein, partial [Salaquimonas sp.]